MSSVAAPLLPVKNLQMVIPSRPAASAYTGTLQVVAAVLVALACSASAASQSEFPSPQADGDIIHKRVVDALPPSAHRALSVSNSDAAPTDILADTAVAHRY